MALLLDIHPLSQKSTDDALEFIFKAIHDRDDGIWSLHESVLIQRLIELFTKRGLDRLSEVQAQILAWESGAKHVPSTATVTPPGMMDKWSTAERGLAKLYLESLPPELWTLNDHMMAIDLVVQTYLPANELQSEAEWLATRASLMGKVQANLDKPPLPGKVDALLAAMPSTVAAAAKYTLKPAQSAAMEYGAARAIENVRALTDTVRHKMRSAVIQHADAKLRGEAFESLETRLVDEFAMLNRDWRRIAVTEAGECQTQGFIASLEPGAKVKRVEQYANACSHCRKIDGTIMEVVAANSPDKDGYSQVWAGKTNIGRSASPRKRVGNELVDRLPSERWWIAAGTQHPHCRGRWVGVVQPMPGDDPAFAELLSTVLS